MALVLAVLGGPDAQGGGAFRFCPGCGELYARAGADRRWLDRRGYRMLAREVLRLRALVPPEHRDERYVARPVAEDGDPALPRTIGEGGRAHPAPAGVGGRGGVRPLRPLRRRGGRGDELTAHGRRGRAAPVRVPVVHEVGDLGRHRLALRGGPAVPSGTNADRSSTPERRAATRRGMAVRETARRSIIPALPVAGAVPAPPGGGTQQNSAGYPNPTRQQRRRRSF